MEKTNEILITLGRFAFEFVNFDNWCDKASSRFRHYGLNNRRIICLDTKHRVCLTGKEFMRARDEECFPVKCYEIVF